MLKKAEDSSSVLRPHFKTHQSIELGRIFKEEGVDKITVSSVEMAKYFADAAWNDILIAFPFNPLEADEINSLLKKYKIGLLASCPDSIPLIIDLIENQTDVYLKIDVGSLRTGFNPANIDSITEAVAKINESDKHVFKGFVAHAGHTYNAKNHSQIKDIFYHGVYELKKLKNIFGSRSNNIIISWGDTPSCSIIENFKGIDELRPGNFVFYDLMQLNLGVCKFDDIAMTLACPVVALHHERNEIVVYAGAVHLSKEKAFCKKGFAHFGMAVGYDDDMKWKFLEDECYIRRVSQEHGIIKASANIMSKVSVGDILGVIPVHACLTADLIRDHYYIE